MRAWIVALLLVLLAGCTDPQPVDLDAQDAEPTPEPEPQEQPPEEPEQNETEQPAPRPNTAPTASLTANTTAGDAPLLVNFTIDGSDADGDDLTWTFDKEDDGIVDDQGTGFPATLEHAYGNGIFTARLAVYDGEASANTTLTLEGFPPEEPEEPAGPVQTLALSWALGVSDAAKLEPLETCGAGAGEDTLYAHFAVDPESRGLPVLATLSAATPTEAIVGWGVLYFDAECSRFHDFSATGAGPLVAKVPGFAAWAIAYSDGGAGLEAAYQAG